VDAAIIVQLPEEGHEEFALRGRDLFERKVDDYEVYSLRG
jgi:hypothetical protein